VNYRLVHGSCLELSLLSALLLHSPLIWAQSELSEVKTTVADKKDITYPTVSVSAPMAPFRQFNKVEITGSSIIRKEQTRSLPVQVIGRAEIMNSGKHNIADFLQTLPVIFNAFSLPLLGAVRSGFSGGAIHGQQLGTLVLINGRRLSNYGRQNGFGVDNGGVDLNALPLSAIERIEILTDGASTTYGTDAQAGVINIITQSERPGVEISVDKRLPDGRVGPGSRVDLSVGQGRLMQDGYSWFIAADLQDQQELLGRDRPYAAAGRYRVTDSGQDYWVYGPAMTAAQTSPTLATSAAAPYTRLWNADFQNGNCPAGKVPALGQPACLLNTYANKGLFPALQSKRLHAQGQLQLNEDMVAYAELSMKTEVQTRSFNDWPQYSARIANAPGAAGYDLAVANGFDPAKGVWLLYNGSDLGPTPRTYELQTRRMVSGVRGLWKDWDFNAGLYYSDNFASFGDNRLSAYPNLGLTGGVLSNAALLNPLAENTALMNQLQSMVSPNRTVSNEGTNSQHGLDVRVSRNVGEIDGRDVLLALGTDWRMESAKYIQSATGTPSFSAQRAVWAQFAELQVPLPQGVEVLASLRNDHYSDFGNTTHGKLAAKWEASERWLFRGAWGTGFRAPALAQMQETGKVLSSRAQTDCNVYLKQVAKELGGSCPSSGVLNVFSQGTSQLKPELSLQLNLGMRFSPDRNQTLSVDYWQMDMRDKISNYSRFILGDPLKYKSHFDLNAQGQLQVFAPMANLGRVESSGVDFSWALRRPTDWGQVNMGVNGTWMMSSKYQQQADEPFVDDLNQFSAYSGYVVPKVRSLWHVALQRPSWLWRATVRHTTSYNINTEFQAFRMDNNQAQLLKGYRVPAWWTLDLLAVHQWRRNTSFRVGIENALNRQAPFDISYSLSTNYGTNPMQAHVWGRTLNLSMTHRF
jgi:iron complex outermembrane receptor protein